MSFLRAMWRRWPNGTVTGIASVVARNVVARNVVAGNVVAGNVVAGNVVAGNLGYRSGQTERMRYPRFAPVRPLTWPFWCAPRDSNPKPAD